MKKTACILLVATVVLVLIRLFIFHHDVSNTLMTGLSGVILAIGAYYKRERA